MFNHAKFFSRSMFFVLILVLIFLMSMGGKTWAQSPSPWKIHDMKRTPPPAVAPGKSEMPAPPPSDAVILFDGKDLSQWSNMKGEPAQWKVENGYMEIAKGGGDIRTRAGFGDVQLHIEWAVPTPEQDKGQDQGNSGVYLMGLYEVQVLDSYQNQTYADGQAAGIYGQYPPLVNACRPPGEWQGYDIVFRRPRFDGGGNLLRPARLTVLHNGVLVQDNVALWGPTTWLQFDPYKPQPDKLPISLQDHGSPVRYRNIWLRELPDPVELTPPVAMENAITLAPNVLDRYAGRYEVSPGRIFTLKREGDKLFANFYSDRWFEIVAHSEREFSMRRSAVDLKFDLGSDGQPKSFVFQIGGREEVAKKVAEKAN